MLVAAEPLRRIAVRRHVWTSVWAACTAALVAWWLGTYPALLSPDSASYTWQITHSHWYLGGSVVYDALQWLSMQLTGSVAALTLLQVVTFAAAVTLVARGIHRLGVRTRYAAAAALVVCAAPMTGAFVAYLSKDMLFVVGQLLCLAGLLELLSKPERTWRPLPVGLLIAGTTTMTLCRQNGVEMLIVATVVVFVLARRVWRPVGVACLAGTAAWALVTFGIAPLAGATPANSSLLLGPAYGDIGVVYREDPTLFTAADTILMARVAPLSVWRDKDGCYSSDGLTSGTPDFVGNAAAVHTQLDRLWLRLVVRAPARVLQARLCRGSIAWDPFPAALHTVLPPLRTPADLYGWRSTLGPLAEDVLPDQPIPLWHRAVTTALHATTAKDAQFLLWRGATWTYLAYFAVAVAAWRRRSLAIAAAAAFVLANQLVVLADVPNQIARYMMGSLFMGAMLVPLAFAKRRVPALEGGETAIAGDGGGEPEGEPATSGAV